MDMLQNISILNEMPIRETVIIGDYIFLCLVEKSFQFNNLDKEKHLGDSFNFPYFLWLFTSSKII